MPRAYDRHQIALDHNPLNQLDPNTGNLPKLEPWSVLTGLLAGFKEITGIDLTGTVDFINWLGDTIGLALVEFAQAWQRLLDGIVRVFTGVSDGITKFVEDVIDAIDGIFGAGKDAGLSAANANIGVEKLKAQQAGGGFDEFDYAESPTLPTGTYALLSTGPGAGTYGPNGNGFLVWKPSGSAVCEIIYRRIGAGLSGNNGVVTAVWANRPYDPFFADTYGYICGRMSNASNATHIRVKIDNNTARFQSVITGTATDLGSAVTLTIRNGDVFEFWYGTTAHPRRLWLVQNGVTVHTVDDGLPDGTGSVSIMDSDHRSVGFGCRVDSYLYWYGFGQNPAPALAGWTWAVQTTA